MKLTVALVLCFLGRHSTKHFLVELGNEKTEDTTTKNIRAGNGRAVPMRHPSKDQSKDRRGIGLFYKPLPSNALC